MVKLQHVEVPDQWLWTCRQRSL